MPTKPAEDLEAFLKRQDPSTLVGVLIELANDHEAVQARLARLQLADRPEKLAAGFRKTLSAWCRSSKFFSYREAREFGRTLAKPPSTGRCSRPSSTGRTPVPTGTLPAIGRGCGRSQPRVLGCFRWSNKRTSRR